MVESVFNAVQTDSLYKADYVSFNKTASHTVYSCVLYDFHVQLQLFFKQLICLYNSCEVLCYVDCPS
jgi:hypothetical protein